MHHDIKRHVNMKLSPKVITGALHAQNKGASDWGWQGLLSYGCQGFIVIVDPKTVQVLQVLAKHKGNVVKVKWAKENYHHDLGSPYSLRLASGDTNGVIIVWDVAAGIPKSEFSEGNKPIQDLEWLTYQDASHDLLVVLHPPYSLVLWNADTGTKLWKKSYTEPLLSFSFDPFNSKNVAFLGSDSIVFIEDFSVTKVPSSNGKKFYISSPSSTASSNLKTDGSTSNVDKRLSSKNLAERMSKILVGEGPSKKNSREESDQVALNDCIQLLHHQSCRHHLILVYTREILILDLEINQTVGIIPIERAGSPFVQIFSFRQRDVLLCLHENGSVTTRIRRKTNAITTPASEGHGAFDDSPPPVSMDVTYDLRCQSDGMRVTRHSRVSSLACCPVTEKSVALMVTDSRVVFWDMMLVDGGIQLETRSQLDKKPKFPVISDISPPNLSLSDMIGRLPVVNPDHPSVLKGRAVALKFMMTGLLNGVVSPISCLRACPPLTTKNWSMYEPLIAVGSSSGVIQIQNISSGLIAKEYSVHTGPVRGVEWCSLKSILSYSYQSPGPSGLVKNDLMFVDISTGKVKPVRTNRDQESPIEILRVSCLKQYFIVGFKDKPLELWDLQTLTMLRETGKSLPYPTALEWSPSHSLKSLKRKMMSQTGDKEGTQLTPAQGDKLGVSTTSLSEANESESKVNQKMTVKEHFVYTDSEGTLYHFVVEGTGFADASRVPAESGMGTITWIAWKGDFILFGDGEGQLSVWDLKSKTQRTMATRRGWIKKIRFAPGRGNMKFFIQYNDGFDVWDLKDGKAELLSSIKSPRDVAKVTDADWTGSDRPVLATADGCVQVFDLLLKSCSCGIEEREFPDEVANPYTLSPKGSLMMKYHLQNQPWNPEFTLKLEGLREGEQNLQTAVNKQIDLLDSDTLDYLPLCRFGVAERCLMLAKVFGDESDFLFWTVALYYLRAVKWGPKSQEEKDLMLGAEKERFIPATPPHKETNDLVMLDSPDEEGPDQEMWSLVDLPLERYLDTVCDNDSFKLYQLDRVALHDSKRVTYDHTKKCAENYIMLRETDRAVQLLLETEPDNDTYYTDCLRACLVASIRSSGVSQSTIKLVATNLIANGKIKEGVQLLCLIDKGLDACRYLQTYGAWDQAVWLAKATLADADCCEVMKRWVDHLCGTQVNQKSKALLVMLSLGQFSKVLEMLYGMRQFNRAACFSAALEEFGLLDQGQDNVSLVEAVYLEYARLLANLGLRAPAEYYCQRAGSKGNQFREEVRILFS
ncbi:WD repeat-containing protein 11-like [Ostrea edulis]|uniref:WD repeat-containing protein 11-like n=1 Tax=Ostrea edulis TaxID=37623 RepID=UPI0024AFD14E|nr:WD repeat-containing protein 11-like [Ostrea edulis]